MAHTISDVDRLRADVLPLIKKGFGKKVVAIEGLWYMETDDGGTHFRHESCHFREIPAGDTTYDTRFLQVIAKKENPNETTTITFSSGNDKILDAVSVQLLCADPVYKDRRVTIRR